MKVREKIAFVWAALLHVCGRENKLLIYKNAVVDFGPAGFVSSMSVLNADKAPDSSDAYPGLGGWEQWTVVFDGRKVIAKVDGKVVAQGVIAGRHHPSDVHAQV